MSITLFNIAAHHSLSRCMHEYLIKSLLFVLVVAKNAHSLDINREKTEMSTHDLKISSLKSPAWLFIHGQKWNAKLFVFVFAKSLSKIFQLHSNYFLIRRLKSNTSRNCSSVRSWMSFSLIFNQCRRSFFLFLVMPMTNSCRAFGSYTPGMSFDR